MIVSRAPLRVSFIGGGTDYQHFVDAHGGHVIAAAINKYVYVNILNLPAFAREKFRFTYRITESVEQISSFLHPSLRETLSVLKWSAPLNIATMADVPGSSGLGSSSAFVVALKSALDAMQGIQSHPEELAKFAIEIERVRLAEPGGIQDQYEAAYGGLNEYRFSSSGCSVTGFNLTAVQFSELSEYFSLVSVIGERSTVAHAENTSRAKEELLTQMLTETEIVAKRMRSATSISDLASTLQSAISTDWEIKKYFSPQLADSNSITAINTVRNAGANSVKLCGAGGSGFLLVGHDPGFRENLKTKFERGFVLSPDFISEGTKVILK